MLYVFITRLGSNYLFIKFNCIFLFVNVDIIKKVNFLKRHVYFLNLYLISFKVLFKKGKQKP